MDAHYYSPGWTGDLRTMVHILPDGETQVYSSLIYDGPKICTVFNGIYKVAFDAFNFGMAAAASMLLFAVILIVTTLYLRVADPARGARD